MRLDSLAAAISDVASRFEIVVAKTDDELDEVFRLRYQVYCLERGFEPAVGGREIDRFDRLAVHALLRHRVSGQPLGTVRLVTRDPEGGSIRFPIDEVCDAPLIRQLPHDSSAEISRFALSKTFRAESGFSMPLLRLFLIRGIVLLSGMLRVTHWCALMEPCFLRLLRANSVHFQAAGELVDHHGLRQPSYGVVVDMLAQLGREQPLIWDFVTEGGTLWEEPKLLVAA